MPYTTAGLPNSGQTQYFIFEYDDSLSSARGVDLATEMMKTSDADLSLLAAWFSGRQLDMSPPIHVSINAVALDAMGNPIGDIGSDWMGGFLVPLQLTITFGELAMMSGTPIMFARYLLISSVSEMYMRAFGTYGSTTPWFALTNAGNKGDALSRFLGEQFMLREYPGISALPSLTMGVLTCTNFWLNSARNNFLEENDEDVNPMHPGVAGATLFLMYLHDQLGYSIEDIVNAGAGHLSNVYENLSHDSWTNAWPKFSALVNGHYPTTPGTSGDSSPYFPPLDTVFPVPDLAFFSAPSVATWLATSPVPVVIAVDHPAIFPLPLVITSSDATIIPGFVLTIGTGMTSGSAPLVVLPQAANFMTKKVTLTVSYAGRTLTRDVTVLELGATTFGPLDIEVDPSGSLCSPMLIANTGQTFVITNLNVFPDQRGLKFAWSVTGATPAATNTETLTIAALPPVGTSVTIKVTVTNPQGLSAAGTYKFQTVSQPTGIKAIENELRCRLSNFRNGNLSIPPWIPIERGGEIQERLEGLERQVQAASKSIVVISRLIKQMQTLNAEHIDRGPQVSGKQLPE
ncbi:hypothetical protein [Terriglobus roseus]|uniref:Uncharacterized protein n=1 Tax=Terriglobus roseus TaxID=392734 RepID=A0A1G7MQ97_9BACT|nr:hypothetical protein [Terriglobus roseus]SDF63289.1 hypothetical protein SAMN05444167_2859 [Terriglobus roseus]